MDRKTIDKLGEIGRQTVDRREFLKKAGKVAATVPAVALLLSANATPAEAFNRYCKPKGGHGRPHRRPFYRLRGKLGHGIGHARPRLGGHRRG